MDLFDLLEKIAPVLVFLFWIMISIFSQSRKTRQKKSREAASSTNANSQYKKPDYTSGRSPYETTKKQSQKPTFEDLKKKLETIFNESLPQIDEDDESTIKETNTQPPAPMIVKPEITSEESTKPELLQKVVKKWYSHGDFNAYDQPESTSGQTSLKIDLSIEKIREGFILSEIIAPPIALRDDRW
ncbi:MAG: hypothetical protein JW915_00120 [Chitinispirillaceae bacterium]|nr:hypothetical protein [Chitinispirillaceae bacterium]